MYVFTGSFKWVSTSYMCSWELDVCVYVINGYVPDDFLLKKNEFQCRF